MRIMKFTYHLFPQIRSWIEVLPDSRITSRCTYRMDQVVFCVLMMFMMRYRSLRSFCKEHGNSEWTLFNFQKYISINAMPSDDEFRYVLNAVPTMSLNLLLKKIHSQLERKKILDSEKFLDHLELVSMDGSGQISSTNIACEKCLLKKHGDDDVLHLHGQLVMTLTNSKGSYSLPLYYEPIENSDTRTQYSKNDCEIVAAKRAIESLKGLYSKRNFCFLGDNLFAVKPIVEMILERKWSFIFTAKPERNKEFFDWYEYLKEDRKTIEVIKDKRKFIYVFRNKLPLNQIQRLKVMKDSIWVNYLEMTEINLETGAIIYHNTWMTNIEINQQNVQIIAEGGRARFSSIENRTFNELKNRGYQMGHNFGHKGNLPNVFFGLMLIVNLLTQLFCLWKKGKNEIAIIGSVRRYFETLGVLVAHKVLKDEERIIYLKFEFNTS